MTTRPVRNLAALALVSVLALFAAGCGGDSDGQATPDTTAVALAANAPGYCKQLATLPADLNTAVANAAGGNASDADKATIGRTAGQLRAAAANSSVPAGLRTTLTAAETALNKLSQGQSLSQEDATHFSNTFQKLGEAVDETCAAK